MDEAEIQDIYKKGLDAYRRGDYIRAGDLLEQVVDADEQNHRAWNALGIVFTKTEKYPDADICFENALSLDPSNEVYERNRLKNKRHIKRGLKDYLSADAFPIPVNPLYLIGGIVAIIIILLSVFVILPLLHPAPISTTAGDIPVLIETSDDLVIITNSGGPGTNLVSYFTLTANNQTLSGSDGLMRILRTEKDSTLAIPLEELRSVSPSDTVTLMVTAHFSDMTSRVVKTETITLPAAPEVVVEATPVPVAYNPGFKKGDIVLSGEGVYHLISETIPGDRYLVTSMDRRNDGLFIIARESRNVSMSEFDTGATLTRLSFRDPKFSNGTPLQAYSGTSGGPGTYPLYVPGDIISSSSGPGNEAVIILGYDPGTDEYATDALFRYASGDWGYRPDAVSEWITRADVERMFPSRVNRIALSRIGTGSDSSPPGTPPLYTEGDIIAKDRGADSDQLLVLAYDPGTSRYETDTIRRTYGGDWERTGVNNSVPRSQLEQNYPYKVRNVDVALVKINR